ncbi:hypothetical protein PXD56_06630 [Maribacter sp. SA7]|uniref:hypothetical protein n=1 Tax=Maribacter zhoushanensis TaxID=3030012 RepID=UPI0023EB5CC8|nr:hypothetical protein [Maribacter zhoushanensis]MDF4202620.1 hypothetical protein [Maribacter zhoushanensis]
MNKNFFFNYDEYDFWPLYDSIQKYYPIGIKKNQEFDIYRNYKGIQELENLLLDKIGPENTNYNKNWESFIERISKELGKKILGTIYGIVPSYSAFLSLETEGNEDRWKSKELHFSVSHLGKFYQVYGIEKSVRKSVIIGDGEELSYQTENLTKIVVSPVGEYKNYFERIENYITEEFREYRLVPFKIGQTIIDGLQILHMDNEKCSINMALFNDFVGFGEQVDKVEPEGNLFYGMESWKK